MQSDSEKLDLIMEHLGVTFPTETELKCKKLGHIILATLTPRSIWVCARCDQLVDIYKDKFEGQKPQG